MTNFFTRLLLFAVPPRETVLRRAHSVQTPLSSSQRCPIPTSSPRRSRADAGRSPSSRRDVVGDGPRRVEHAPQRERCGAADRGAVAEGRRNDGERPGPRGERALLERLADAVREPRRERAEAAAEHDGPEVEEVERRRQRDPQPPPCVVERGEDGGRPVLRATDELVGQAPRAAGHGGDAGGPCDGLLTDERLDAPAAAAGAGSAFRIDGDVPELAAEAVRPAEEAAAEHDAAADADLAEDADEVVDPDRRARPVLGERGEVRLVLDQDRQPEPRLELGGDRRSAQPMFGASTTVPDASSTRPGTATVTPAGRSPSAAAASSASRGALPRRSSTRRGAEPRLSRYDRRS